METIHGDELVSSLLVAGYNKVDMLYFYPFVKDRILHDPSINSLVCFDASGVCSNKFKKHVKLDDHVWTLIESSPSDVVKASVPFEEILVGDELPINKILIDYILRSDFTDVIIRKALEIGIDMLPQRADLFSNKEINVIKEKYGNNVFGELYASYDLEVEDYSKFTDQELIDLFKDSTNKNYIYKYLLTDHQRLVLDKYVFTSKNLVDPFIYYEKKQDELRNASVNSVSDQYLIIDLISARSRNKRRNS